MSAMSAQREQLKLAAYLGAAFALAALSDPRWLALALAVAVVSSGPARGRLLQRSLRTLLPFLLALDIAWGLFALWQARPFVDWLLVTNLRALTLTFLGFWALSAIDLLRALAPWPAVAMLIALAQSQIRLLERLLVDFRHAFISRHPAPPTPQARARLAAAQASALLDKSVAASAEATHALRSRGALDV